MNLLDPRFTDPNAAREWLESQRWADGLVCSHCVNADQAKIKALAGKAHRPGVYEFNECREQFDTGEQKVWREVGTWPAPIRWPRFEVSASSVWS